MSKKPNDPEATQVAALADLRVLIGRLHRRLREQSDLGDLNWSQISVLSRLEREGPATVTDLARAEGMRPQSMGANIAALETAGLVTGAPDPADGRRTILSLTVRCGAWIKAGRAAREDWLSSAIRKTYAPKDRKKVAAAVRLLTRLSEA